MLNLKSTVNVLDTTVDEIKNEIASIKLKIDDDSEENKGEGGGF